MKIKTELLNLPYCLLAVFLIGLLTSNFIAFGGDARKTEMLVTILGSNTGLFEKARACQQLGEVGTEDAIPALAQLLSDEHLSAYARSGLEGIGGPKAAQALRTAAGRLQGKLLAGVVNSLGVLRDQQAVELLARQAQEPGSGVANESLSALGKISDPPAMTVLKKVITQGPDSLRPAAAAGCLLAAQQQLKQGNEIEARKLYDAVTRAQVPASFRLGAIRGAILARGSGRVAFLIQQLHSTDPVARQAALITIREIPDEPLALALNKEVRRAKPDLEAQLLAALVDCHNQESFTILQTKASSGPPQTRLTALKVLNRIGNAAEAGFLLNTVSANRSPEETSLALASLERLQEPAVDNLILNALSTASDAEEQVKLIRLLDTRGATNANAELVRFASAPDVRVSVAALEALKPRAGATELPTLIALTKTCQDDSRRTAAEGALSGACSAVGNAGSETVLKELNQTTNPAEKNSWVRVLTSLGYAPALPSIERTLTDADEGVVANSIEQLGQWPDPAPMEALFGMAENNQSPQRRQTALASIIHLARAAAEEHQRPDEVTVAWLARAGKDSTSVAERRLIISGLGHLSHPQSFQLLAKYLQEPDLKAEAAVAILQIAPALAGSSMADQVKQGLQTIAATAATPEIRDQATKISAEMAKKATVLFDGTSLNGWEGDTNVWRVRDGIIVGGSFAGNPRNEFLATARSYTNFVLRLEYKLTGTEGFINSGVQFHSVRVVQPPNEMSGYQADIGAGYSGCLYDESRRNKFLARASEEQVKRLERLSDWNRYEVRCQGPRIQILLNGEKTVDYTEPDAAIPHAGLIGLQIHGGSKAEVCFRNIVIEEFP